MHGLIFRIQRCCLHDGPGIRTTVFLSGCPLRCAWCHNPGHPDGVLLEAGAVLDRVRADAGLYLRTGGGLTLSGGEPLAQPDFGAELLARARAEGMHTAVETSGALDPMPWHGLVDLWLYDLKHTDADAHARWTGGGLAPVLAHLAALRAAGARVRLRLPLVPGVNDDDRHVAAVAALAADGPALAGIELMPYHPLAVGASAGVQRAFPTPDPERLAAVARRLGAAISGRSAA